MSRLLAAAPGQCGCGATIDRYIVAGGDICLGAATARGVAAELLAAADDLEAYHDAWLSSRRCVEISRRNLCCRRRVRSGPGGRAQ